ncbi:MAG: toluene tolerance protein [Porticoccaceae bacterium]|nr:toluene tolerance protein [Porticoccaceae bacterium]
MKRNRLPTVAAITVIMLSSFSSLGEIRGASIDPKVIFIDRSSKKIKEFDVKIPTEQNFDPFDLIDKLTVSLVQIISTYKNTDPLEEEVFIKTITEQMSPHIDFWRMSRAVMGKYRKVATEKQLAEFTNVFQKSMLETYGRGLLSFNDEKIIIINRRKISRDEQRVSVKQEIHSLGKVYPLSYTMRKSEAGAWVISNVVIDGINLGKTLRNQFGLAAQKNGGNLDTVIENWLANTE